MIVLVIRRESSRFRIETQVRTLKSAMPLAYWSPLDAGNAAVMSPLNEQQSSGSTFAHSRSEYAPFALIGSLPFDSCLKV